MLAAERSREAVVDALRRGAFYGSAGPRLIGVEVGEDAVEVRCSPVRVDAPALRAVGRVRCERRRRVGRLAGRARCHATQSGLLTAARFEYPEYWRWARVEVEDAQGRRAWGNAFQLPGEPPAATEFPVY